MRDKFSVYRMKKLMRQNGASTHREELFFKKMIDATLDANFIEYVCIRQYPVTIPDFGYKPKLDLAYQLHNKKICIEVDGPYHDDTRQELFDKYRDEKLVECGWLVHRLKSWRYEPIWDQVNRLTLDTLKKCYVKMFVDLKPVFRWEKPISDSELCTFL